MQIGPDREKRVDESLKLIFEALALLAGHTLAHNNPTHADLMRALRSCAETKGGANARNELESALAGYCRYPSGQ
ncbi:MAG TPA: hypothetical protein VHC45_07505 [Gaiellaceae bacterium]|nr:hypothetical protein [Gaiellaceae bacterium]